jgi:hypothetical protein
LFLTTYLYTFSQIFQICAAIYQLPLHMVFTSRNWFAMQGPVAIILISWNVIFIWETGSSIYLNVKLKALASWIFLSFTSFWRNSDSYEYKNKSARRGAQLLMYSLKKWISDHILCNVMSIIVRPVSCVPNVVSVSGLSISNCAFEFLWW